MVEKQRINSNFTSISNEIIHSKLDLKTKAVLYYALSSSEDYTPNKETLIEDLKICERSFRKISKELQENKYLTIKRISKCNKPYSKYIYSQPSVKTSFTKIPNKILKDEYLDLDARALLVYGLSFSEVWTFNKSNILRDNNLGERGWRRIYKQLTQFGYLEYKPHKAVIECDYIFRSEPKLTPKSLDLQKQATEETYQSKIKRICLLLDGHDTHAPRLARLLRTRTEMLDSDVYENVELQICEAILFSLEMKKKYKIKQNAFQQYESYYSDLKLDMKGLYFPRSVALACEEIDMFLKTTLTILFNVSDRSTSDILLNTLMLDSEFLRKYHLLQKNNEIVDHPKEGTIYWFSSDYEDIVKARALTASLDPLVALITMQNFEKLLKKKNDEQSNINGFGIHA